MNALFEKIKKHYGGVVSAHCIKFESGDSSFCVTNGRVYQTVDDRFCGTGKAAKTLAAVVKFVELRA